MTMLFEPGNIGTLALPNRLVRSATAERLADAGGRPKPRLEALYQELARGGVGLIITGHTYVHPSGKAHPEMTGIHSDGMVPGLTELADAVHREGGRVVVQINHGGMQCSRETVSETIVTELRVRRVHPALPEGILILPNSLVDALLPPGQPILTAVV